MPYQTASTTCNSSGAAVVTFQPRGSDRWRVRQVSVEMVNSPGSARCAVRLNGFLVSPAVAAGDAVGGDPPIDVAPGDAMTVEWSGGLSGRVCKAIAFYDLVPVGV